MTLAELVYGYLEYRERPNKPDELWCKCPFCQDTKYRFGINLRTGQAHCFKGSCDWKTRDKRYLFSELCRLLNIHEQRLSEEDVQKHKKSSKKVKPEKVRLPSEFEPLWRDISDSVGRKALAYVLDRGITHKQIVKHKLGFCAVGKYAGRIIFPVLDRKLKLKGLVGRDFTGASDRNDEIPKYLNSEGNKILYNSEKKKSDVASLGEGPIDALALERALPELDNLGRLGQGLTTEQKKILKRYKKVYVWPDPDGAGVELAVKLCREMYKKVRMFVVVPEKNDADPGKLGMTVEGLKEIRRRIKNAVPWSNSVPSLLRLKVIFDE